VGGLQLIKFLSQRFQSTTQLTVRRRVRFHLQKLPTNLDQLTTMADITHMRSKHEKKTEKTIGLNY